MTSIPTIAQLRTDILADLENEFGTVSLVGKVFLRALAYVQAAKLKLFYLALADVQKNVFIDTANRDQVRRWGLVKMGRNPFPATQGIYTVSASFTGPATLRASLTFKSDDTALSPGKLFVLDTLYTYAGPGAGTGTFSLRALESGLDSRLAVGDTLTATEPLIAAAAVVTVTVETTIPQAEEDIEDYRTKGIESFRLEPQGGAGADYRLWGKDAQGVQQIYPYVTSGQSNEVDVFVEATIADSSDGFGTPTTAILDDVADVIELDPDTTLPDADRGRRPLAVFQVNVLPIVVKDVDITITGLVDDSSANRALIDAALAEAVALMRPFIPSVDVIASRNDVISKNIIIQVILNTIPGAQFTSVTLEVDGSPLSSYTFDNGIIPHLNTVTYA